MTFKGNSQIAGGEQNPNSRMVAMGSSPKMIEWMWIWMIAPTFGKVFRKTPCEAETADIADTTEEEEMIADSIVMICTLLAVEDYDDHSKTSIYHRPRKDTINSNRNTFNCNELLLCHGLLGFGNTFARFPVNSGNSSHIDQLLCYVGNVIRSNFTPFSIFDSFKDTYGIRLFEGLGF